MSAAGVFNFNDAIDGNDSPTAASGMTLICGCAESSTTTIIQTTTVTSAPTTTTSTARLTPGGGTRGSTTAERVTRSTPDLERLTTTSAARYSATSLEDAQRTTVQTDAGRRTTQTVDAARVPSMTAPSTPHSGPTSEITRAPKTTRPRDGTGLTSTGAPPNDERTTSTPSRQTMTVDDSRYTGDANTGRADTDTTGDDTPRDQSTSDAGDGRVPTNDAASSTTTRSGRPPKTAVTRDGVPTDGRTTPTLDRDTTTRTCLLYTSPSPRDRG